MSAEKASTHKTDDGDDDDDDDDGADEDADADLSEGESGFISVKGRTLDGAGKDVGGQSVSNDTEAVRAERDLRTAFLSNLLITATEDDIFAALQQVDQSNQSIPHVITLDRNACAASVA